MVSGTPLRAIAPVTFFVGENGSGTSTLLEGIGFFLRAEEFFGFTKRLAQERAELQARMREVETEYRAADRSPKRYLRRLST